MAKNVMDGTEQTLFESTELGEYSGYVFLDQMQSGDEIVLKVYIKDVEDGNYKLRESVTFTGVQDTPAIEIRPIIGKVGIKVTAQQTSGTYRTVTSMWFKR